MAGLTRANMRDEVQAMIGWRGTESDTSVNRYLNLAGREIWVAHEWPERKMETVLSTVIPYSTGTVDLTNAATTCVGSGTTFVTGMTGRKISLSYDDPWYRVTYVGATSLTLGRNYLEATTAGATYTLWQDEYDLPTTMESLQSAALLLEADVGHLKIVDHVTLDGDAIVPLETGRPASIGLVTPGSTATTRRVRVWPIPDAEYAIVVRGLKTWTEFAVDGDYSALGPNADRLIIEGACLLMGRFKTASRVITREQWMDDVHRLWMRSSRVSPKVGYRRRFDQSGRGTWNTFGSPSASA